MNEDRSPRWPRYAVYTLIIIVILLIALIVILFSIRSPLIFRSSAFSSSTVTESRGVQSLSLENSYIFASPLRAKTGGEKIRITVFILDNRGLGISGKKVVVGGGNSLQVAEVQPVTDAQGRATFDISSASFTGVYIIQAAIDGINLIQQTTVTFD
ncbi:MAG: Ig-like domain-containing protein [Candidatus Woesebacteria bacterium]|nr:MAG: Ig-like domain-containing protein [Candidatus Woesebacteria bacterium]